MLSIPASGWHEHVVLFQLQKLEAVTTAPCKTAQLEHGWLQAMPTMLQPITQGKMMVWATCKPCSTSRRCIAAGPQWGFGRLPFCSLLHQAFMHARLCEKNVSCPRLAPGMPHRPAPDMLPSSVVLLPPKGCTFNSISHSHWPPCIITKPGKHAPAASPPKSLYVNGCPPLVPTMAALRGMQPGAWALAQPTTQKGDCFARAHLHRAARSQTAGTNSAPRTVFQLVHYWRQLDLRSQLQLDNTRTRPLLAGRSSQAAHGLVQRSAPLDTPTPRPLPPALTSCGCDCRHQPPPEVSGSEECSVHCSSASKGSYGTWSTTPPLGRARGNITTISRFPGSTACLPCTPWCVASATWSCCRRWRQDSLANWQTASSSHLSVYELHPVM
jgi:hypothetical protein